jgi:hypothetical protein
MTQKFYWLKMSRCDAPEVLKNCFFLTYTSACVCDGYVREMKCSRSNSHSG